MKVSGKVIWASKETVDYDQSLNSGSNINGEQRFDSIFVIETEEGKLYLGDMFSSSCLIQVNFNPFTGEPARKLREDFKGYTVVASQGQGEVTLDMYPTFNAAMLYIKENEGSASFGIKMPDNSYYKWPLPVVEDDDDDDEDDED